MRIGQEGKGMAELSVIKAAAMAPEIRYRRILLIAGRSGQGPLIEAIAAAA